MYRMIERIAFNKALIKLILLAIVVQDVSATSYMIPKNIYNKLVKERSAITLSVELNKDRYSQALTAKNLSVDSTLLLKSVFNGRYKAYRTFENILNETQGIASQNLSRKASEFENFYQITIKPKDHTYEEYVTEFNKLLNDKVVVSVYTDAVSLKKENKTNASLSDVNIENDSGYHFYYALKERPKGDTEGGINAKYAWERGYTGQDIKVIDIEYTHANHTNDDLPALFYDAKCSNSHPWCQNFDGSHGTSVAGVIAAKKNNSRTVGIAYNAKIGFQTDLFGTQEGRNPAAAILKATNQLKAGDIILMEEQTIDAGLVSGSSANCLAIRNAIARGIVVVETAGNYANNLDEYPVCDAPVIVVSGDRQYEYSRWQTGELRGYADNLNYGSPVVAHAPGDYIVTTGLNNTINYRFRSTSGAAPIVVGAIALIQSAAKDIISRPLNAQEVKEIIQQTGLRYRGNKPIGYWVDVKAAIEELDNRNRSEKGANYIRYKSYLIPITK